MHVQQPFRARALVQVVDVLSDDQQLAVPFGIKPRQCHVRRIRAHPSQRRTPQIIEAMDQIRIARERLGRADVLDPVSFSNAVRIVILPVGDRAMRAERGDARLGGDASAGKDNDVADVMHSQSFWSRTSIIQCSVAPCWREIKVLLIEIG